MDHMPGAASASIFQKKWVIEILTVVFPIIAACVTVWNNYSDPDKQWSNITLVAGIVWLIIASLARVVHAYHLDKKETKQNNYEGLLGAANVLYSTVSKHLQYDDGNSGKLRITMHRVTFKNKKSEPVGLVQMIPYVGGKGGEAGRAFTINPGIIGHVARNGKVRVATRVGDDQAAFVSELMSNWFYTEAEARSLTSDRKTWMAVPILSKDKNVLVVVYLDSTEREAFSDSVIQIVINGCIGVASYISQHYGLQVESALFANASPGNPIQQVVEVSAEGASLKQKDILLTGDSEQGLTSTAASISAEITPPKA
jgi:hypothetical protein